MANHKATLKDVRQATKRRERNKYYGKTTRNAIRDLKEIKSNGEATPKLIDVASMLDKLAKKGEEFLKEKKEEWNKFKGAVDKVLWEGIVWG